MQFENNLFHGRTSLLLANSTHPSLYFIFRLPPSFRLLFRTVSSSGCRNIRVTSAYCCSKCRTLSGRMYGGGRLMYTTPRLAVAASKLSFLESEALLWFLRLLLTKNSSSSASSPSSSSTVLTARKPVETATLAPPMRQCVASS